MKQQTMKSLTDTVETNKFTITIPTAAGEDTTFMLNLQQELKSLKHSKGTQLWVHWVDIIRAGAKELGYLEKTE